MSAVLKSIGLKNYYFHLALLNPLLQGVDPYSPNLTFEQKAMIALEVQLNPWYFFREVARISSGSTALQFRLVRPSLSMLWCFFNGIDYVLIMPRQIGKSITGDFLEIWLLNYYYQNTTMILFTKDDKLRAETIERIKGHMSLLPKWLNPQIVSGKDKDADNTEILTCNRRNNEYKGLIGQPNKLNASNVGRGGTYPYKHTDEVPWIVNVDESLPVLQFAMGAARENAEENDEYHGAIYTTTAGKKDSKSGKYAYHFVESGMYWNEMLYDTKDKYEAREIVKMNSTGGKCLVNGTFNHRQAGKTDEWLRNRISAAQTTRDVIERDMLNHWTSGSESQALSLELLAIIDASERDPEYISVSVDRYMFRWYIPQTEIEYKMQNGFFGIGLDSSNAIGRDANGISLIDFKDLSIKAAMNVSEANLHKFAIWLADFMIRYSNTILIIENKSSAQGILDTIASKMITAGINPFKRIYNRVVDNYVTRADDFNLIKDDSLITEAVYMKYKKDFGFMTTGRSREFLYDTVLIEAIKSVGHLIYDKVLSNELKGLIIKNGRVDHPEGGHDDLVISSLLVHWFIKHTKNLSFYGIDQFYAMRDVCTEGSLITKEEIAVRQQITAIKNDIINLKERLKAAPSITEGIRDELLIKHKLKQLTDLGDTTLSLDSIMSEISESKTSKRKLRDSLSQLNQYRIHTYGYYK